jgi:hypothetical protein
MGWDGGMGWDGMDGMEGEERADGGASEARVGDAGQCIQRTHNNVSNGHNIAKPKRDSEIVG